MAIKKISLYDENGNFLKPDEFKMRLRKEGVIEKGIRESYKNALITVLSGFFSGTVAAKTMEFPKSNNQVKLKQDWERIGKDLMRAIKQFSASTKKVSESR